MFNLHVKDQKDLVSNLWKDFRRFSHRSHSVNSTESLVKIINQMKFLTKQNFVELRIKIQALRDMALGDKAMMEMFYQLVSITATNPAISFIIDDVKNPPSHL